MAMIEVCCKDCGTEIPMACYNVPEDLNYVPELKKIYEEKEIHEESFFDWIKDQIDQGILTYGEFGQDYPLFFKGIPFLNEAQRWERDGCKCPECGSTNTYWI